MAGAAPYVAEEIKAFSGDNDTLRLTAHAVAGAVLAKVQGHSALAGGAGALSAEAAAKVITESLYPGIANSELTEQQKETISAASTLVGGLAGGLTGKGLGDVVAGAQAGKNAVENNSLGGAAGSGLGMWLGEIPDADVGETAELAGDIAKGNAKVSAHLAGTVGLAMLPGGAQVAAGISAGANAILQYAVEGEVSYTDTLIAGWVGGLTANTGFGVTVGLNAAGGAASNAIKGDDPLTGAIISGAGASVGYGVGKLIQKPLEKIMNPNWKNYEWVDMGLGIFKPVPESMAPSISGNIGSSLASEGSNYLIKEQAKKKTQDK